MERNTKLRVLSGIGVLMVATGLTLSSPENTSISKKTVRYLVNKIYGEETKVDDEFVMAYIEAEMNAYEEAGNHMSKLYNPDYVIANNDEMFELTDWIPTVEEVKSYCKK